MPLGDLEPASGAGSSDSRLNGDKRRRSESARREIGRAFCTIRGASCYWCSPRWSGSEAAKIWEAWRTRKAIRLLEDEKVTPGAVLAAARHGRAGLLELFRLLGSSENEAVRDAAGYALSVIWARDELIGEEEKAVVRRGFQVSWNGRMRYPCAIRSEIPFSVSYGVPFLRDEGEGIKPTNLQWSHRIVGARRASLELFNSSSRRSGRRPSSRLCRQTS